MTLFVTGAAMGTSVYPVHEGGIEIYLPVNDGSGKANTPDCIVRVKAVFHARWTDGHIYIEGLFTRTTLKTMINCASVIS